ncbi:MAG: tetratricopeptide repeat protein [Sphingosinicella sp.]|nr:tetratricopeptide repeat protein [Sphingosinicella sp.]
MALKPADNETFYREVDEELRRERLSGWWQRYGIAAIVGILVLFAVIGGAIWWNNQQRQQAGERGEQLAQIFKDIQAGKTQGLDTRLDQLANEGSPGYRAAALLTKADLAIQAGNDTAAIAGFKSVADDGDIPEPYRNLALIRQTAIEYDKIAPGEVIRRLQPLAQPGNPWFGSAGEMVAGAYLKQNQPQRAAPIFAAMAKDESIPQTLRTRAIQMAGALGVDAVTEAPASSGAAGAAKEATP